MLQSEFSKLQEGEVLLGAYKELPYVITQRQGDSNYIIVASISISDLTSVTEVLRLLGTPDPGVKEVVSMLDDTFHIGDLNLGDRVVTDIPESPTGETRTFVVTGLDLDTYSSAVLSHTNTATNCIEWSVYDEKK